MTSLALALALSLAACGTAKQATPQVSQSAGIHGIVLFVGGPGMGQPSPLPGGFGSDKQGRPYRFVTVAVVAGSGAHAGRLIAQVTPDAQALFTVRLAPGTYVLEPLVTAHGPWPSAVTVTVHPGSYVRTIVYVSGM